MLIKSTLRRRIVFLISCNPLGTGTLHSYRLKYNTGLHLRKVVVKKIGDLLMYKFFIIHAPCGL